MLLPSTNQRTLLLATIQVVKNSGFDLPYRFLRQCAELCLNNKFCEPLHLRYALLPLLLQIVGFPSSPDNSTAEHFSMLEGVLFPSLLHNLA